MLKREGATLLKQVRANSLQKIYEKKEIKNRREQDSNLRGKIPLDFESNALTTRPSRPLERRGIDVVYKQTH